MDRPNVVIFKNADRLAENAAELIVRAGREAIDQQGRFLLVLAGGSTPEKTYARLAEPQRASALDWTKTYVFFGDERLVPPDDPRSNFGMARRTLLDRVPLPGSQVFAIATVGTTAAEAAKAYAAQLARLFPGATGPSPPRFDLVLLGLGEDGHTASLFPGAAALEVQDAWVAGTPPGRLPPPVRARHPDIPRAQRRAAGGFLGRRKEQSGRGADGDRRVMRTGIAIPPPGSGRRTARSPGCWTKRQPENCRLCRRTENCLLRKCT